MNDGKQGVFVGLLDGTFGALPRTWPTSLIVGGVLLAPVSFLFGWAYGALFDTLRRIYGQAAEDPTGLMIAIGLAYLWIILAALAQAVVMLVVRACATEHTARAVRGERAGALEVAWHILRTRYTRLLGQRVLQAAIVSITVAAAVLLASLAIVLGVALKSDVLAALLASVLGLGGFAAAIWISIRYAVTLESMVVDGTGIEQSLDASMDLVRRRWWRVLGYTLLFGLIVSFASSLVATPIMFFSTIRPFMRALQEVMGDGAGSGGLQRVFLELMAGIGTKLGILAYVQGLLGSFVTPVFMTLLFLKLKEPWEPGPAAAPGSTR